MTHAQGGRGTGRWLMAVMVGLGCLHGIAAELRPIAEERLIPLRTDPITVDGDPGEWDLDQDAIVIDPTMSDAGAPISHHNNNAENPIAGAADISARAALAWDEDYLYIVARVSDDDLRGIKPGVAHNVGPAGWACDSCMFLIHSFRDPLRSNTPYSDSPHMALRYEAKPGGRGKLLGNERGQLDKADAYWQLPSGSRFASRETETGYAVEAAVPWSALDFTVQPGEALYCCFLLGDIDEGEALNQLGWHFRDPRERPVFRLDDGRPAMAVLTPAAEQVVAATPCAVRYQADALRQPLRLTRLLLRTAGAEVGVDLNLDVPQGQRADDVVVLPSVPDSPGSATVELRALVSGEDVVLASEAIEILPPLPPRPLVQNPPGEIHRMRPDRVAHNAWEDHYPRRILKHGFVKGREGYERYILTRIRPYTEAYHPNAIKGDGKWVDRTTLFSYTLWRLTGEPRYAEWVRAGLETAMAYQKRTHDVSQLTRLIPLRHFVWQHDPDTELAPPGIEQDFAAAWAYLAEHPTDWMYTEWGYHNRCWHRYATMRLIAHFAGQAGHAVPQAVQDYITWHDERLVSIGDTTDNSSGYQWVFFKYPVLTHQALGTLETLPQQPGLLAAVTRYRQYASPSGAVPHFGDTSGWLTGVASALGYYEMMGSLTGDGRFRWQAHRIAEYLYNHFWPHHDQYHMPRDSVAGGFCAAWLWADAAVAPVAVSAKSRVIHRPRVVDLTPDEEGSKPGLRSGKVTAEQVPDKLLLSSGSGAQDLWAMVELLDNGGHCGRLPGHIVTLLRHDSALLAGQGYYERSQDFNNVVWVEDLEGIAADPRPVRTEIPVLVEDPALTYARVRVRRYGRLPITSVRDIVFVKNGFVLVRDRLTFHATMKVRVGPCWQTRDLGPACGKTWFNTYYDQLYHTGLGLGRGVHAYRNPAWDLLVAFAPREAYRQSVLDRYDDNPYRVSPLQLRQCWSGIIRSGESKVFTSVLLPHPPAFDVKPFVEDVEFLVENDSAVLARVRVKLDPRRDWYDTYWVQLQDGAEEIATGEWRSNARLAVARKNHKGRWVPAVLVDGNSLLMADEDLAADARRPQPQAVYTLGAED